MTNNLAVLKNPDKGVTSYASVHKTLVNMISCGVDGSVQHRQVVCQKDPNSHGGNLILQASWIKFSTRSLLVLATQKGVQMFEPDGSALVYWHGLPEASNPDSLVCYARGICGAETDQGTFVCVGTHKGEILVFSIPPSRNNVTVADTLTGHEGAISALTTEDNKLVSSDEMGNILLWQMQSSGFRQTGKIMGGSSCSVTCLALWKDVIVAGYASGHLRLYNFKTGHLSAEVVAHGRSISAVDVAKNGYCLTVGEDSCVHVWQLKSGDIPEIEYLFGECVTDQQLVGGMFNNDDAKSFGVTGYDSSEITFYRMK